MLQRRWGEHSQCADKYHIYRPLHRYCDDALGCAASKVQWGQLFRLARFQCAAPSNVRPPLRCHQWFFTRMWILAVWCDCDCLCAFGVSTIGIGAFKYGELDAYLCNNLPMWCIQWQCGIVYKCTKVSTSSKIGGGPAGLKTQGRWTFVFANTAIMHIAHALNPWHYSWV